MPRRAQIKNSTDEWRAIAKGPRLLHHIHTVAEEDHWTEESFYASGRSDWEQFLSHWKHFDPDVGGTCVEIGCGAGRLTAPLASYFSSVHSLDVSEDMIARAKQQVGDTVVFHLVSSNKIPLPDKSADAVFTVHVLQHLDDQAAIQSYVDEAFRVLRPGGSIMAHILVGGDRLTLPKRIIWRARLAKSRYQLARGKEHTAVRMVFPTTSEAVQMLRSAGFADVEIRGFPVRSTGGMHSFFVGRKPADSGG